MATNNHLKRAFLGLVSIAEDQGSLAHHGEKNYLAATAEFLVLHVDMQTRKSKPFSPEKLSFLKKVQEEDAHGELSQYGGGIQY